MVSTMEYSPPRREWMQTTINRIHQSGTPIKNNKAVKTIKGIYDERPTIVNKNNDADDLYAWRSMRITSRRLAGGWRRRQRRLSRVDRRKEP